MMMFWLLSPLEREGLGEKGYFARPELVEGFINFLMNGSTGSP